MIFFSGKKTHKGPTFKLSNVQLNAKSVLQACQDLEPIAQVMPKDAQERKKLVAVLNRNNIQNLHSPFIDKIMVNVILGKYGFVEYFNH